MEKNKISIVIAALSLIVAVGVAIFGGKQGPQGPAGPQGPIGVSLGGQTSFDSLSLGGALGVFGTSSLGATLSDLLVYSGDGGFQSTSTAGTCADATTTLFRIQNPFQATSTVTYNRVQVTGVSTSSLVVTVGTTTSSMTYAPTGRHGTSSLASLPIAYAPVDASTTPTLIGGAANDRGNQIFSHATSSPWDGSAVDDASTTPVSRIVVAPRAYLVGFAFDKNAGGVGGAGATNINNAFACTYRAIWQRF